MSWRGGVYGWPHLLAAASCTQLRDPHHRQPPPPSARSHRTLVGRRARHTSHLPRRARRTKVRGSQLRRALTDVPTTHPSGGGGTRFPWLLLPCSLFQVGVVPAVRVHTAVYGHCVPSHRARRLSACRHLSRTSISHLILVVFLPRSILCGAFVPPPTAAPPPCIRVPFSFIAAPCAHLPLPWRSQAVRPDEGA